MIEPILFDFREKRQYNQGFPQNNFFSPSGYDNSQSTAQSHSHSHANQPFGSQNADAAAGAQGI